MDKQIDISEIYLETERLVLRPCEDDSDFYEYARSGRYEMATAAPKA